MAHASSRCLAQTRKGSLCQQAAVRGKSRCRMHGGAPGSGAQPGNRNALKHGHYTADAIAARRMIRQLINASRELFE
ncbi:HGGxSTG domain-containing protein [Candidatus Viadribacter manganicus]|uniref:HGGxSTG domain-containing protein n=1 Tax=Candidatus Viadribacter manganicus TaxID=1759059 RepID=UPI003AAA536D